MKRTILLSGAMSFIMAFAGTIAALTFAMPTISEAQEARIRAERFTVVGDNGADRINLAVGPGTLSTVQVLDANGVPRAWINAGNRGGTDPDNASFAALSPDGVTVARLGMGRGASGTEPLRTTLRLRDLQNRERVSIGVDEDGTPFVRLLDADGNVTGSAP